MKGWRLTCIIENLLKFSDIFFSILLFEVIQEHSPHFPIFTLGRELSIKIMFFDISLYFSQFTINNGLNLLSMFSIILNIMCPFYLNLEVFVINSTFDYFMCVVRSRVCRDDRMKIYTIVELLFYLFLG